MKKIYILMYHFVSEQENNDPLFSSEKRYFLSDSLFDQQMNYLKNNSKIQIIDIGSLFQSDKNTALIITFDDGHDSSYTHAYPILKKYQIPATIFMTTNYIDKPYYLSSKQLKELSDDPLISIQSHSVSHPFLDDLSETEVRYELTESKRIIENITNRPVDVFALPGGRVPKNIEILAKECGYDYVCTSIPGINKNDTMLLKRLDIQRSYDLVHFKKLVENSLYLYKLRFKYYTLKIFKQLLGNTIYLKIRGLVSR